MRRISPSAPSRWLLLGTLALLVWSAVPSAAQHPGTHTGRVFDENGKPVAGVKFRITDPLRPNFEQTEESDKRGRFRILIANATVPYSYELSKPGYQTLSLTGVKIAARQVTNQNFNLTSQEAAAAAAAAAPAAVDIDPEQAARGAAIEIFNKGVAAYNSGDLDTAETLFVSAVEKNADLGMAHAALARLYLKKEEHTRAAAAAEKAVELEADVDSMNQVLYASYSALGEEAKADAALARLKEADPEKASQNLFNEAAGAYNDGDMAAAKTGLEQVLSLDTDHAKANYLLGLVYINEGKNAEAKALLEKFLQLAPEDPDAPTAQEMIKYLNG